jgi:tRNA threonylcarbamoyl adenosine modification protein YeaZ
MILAIDSAIATAVAVVSDDGVVLAESANSDTRGHAEAVGRLIAEVLDAAGVAAAAITAVAAGLGPGPFTGLRVGIAAARAFAAARGIPIVGVASHDAIALANGGSGPLVVTSDARRRELAWSVFDGRDDQGLPVLVAGPALARLDEIDDALGERRAAPRILAEAVPAGALGRIAAIRLGAGLAAGSLEPLYLRAPDATPSTGPKRVTA